MPILQPTLLYRLAHIVNLPILIARGALHAPNTTPNDGRIYRTIHDLNVQASRANFRIPCGPAGRAHDYVPFYFGPLSPMLLKLKSGQVADFNEGQEPLVYLVTSVQRVVASGARYVFSDGHGLATFTNWFDDVAQLSEVDWEMVEQRYWADKPEDNDRQRRKQAEFLIWQSVDWALIEGIGVFTENAKTQVQTILNTQPRCAQRPVVVRTDWYCY